VRVAKVRNFNFSTQRGALDTTGVGEPDRTFVTGVRQTQGTATILYDPADPATRSLISSIFDNSATTQPVISFKINSGTDNGIAANGILTEIGAAVNVGDVVAFNCNFQLSGPVTNNL
jgi:hypothetical protein